MDCATPLPVAGSAAFTQPPPPPTPLEQRQWRRGAQTALRAALTAAKAARTASAAAASEGTAALTEATNATLELAYLPDRPLGVLAGAPGYAAAAAAKLGRACEGALARLDEAWRAMDAAARDLSDAADSVAAHAPPHGGWRASAPVFASIPAPAAAAMLHEVACMHAREAAAKRAMLDALPAALGSGGGRGAGAAAPSTGGGGAGALRERLTVAIAAWLTRPFVDDERADFIVATLDDNMAGF